MSDPWVALAERLDKGLAAAGKMFADGAPLAVVHHGFGYRTDLDFTLGDVRWLVDEVRRLRAKPSEDRAAPAASATWPGPWDCDPHFGVSVADCGDEGFFIVDGSKAVSVIAVERVPVLPKGEKPRGVFVSEAALRERVRAFGPMNAAIRSRLNGQAVNDWLAGDDSALSGGQRQALLNAINGKDGPREVLAVRQEQVRA